MQANGDTFPQSKEQSIFEFKLKDLDGKQVALESHKGVKAILAVNVACACGLTSDNYKQLVDIYNQYKTKGLEVWGFPCNQFGQQESGSENEIRQFVSSKFNVSFPMFGKVEVNGSNTHPLYRFLRTNSQLYDKGTKQTKTIPWNFGKFLLNGQGKVVKFYGPKTQPNDIVPDIKKLLDA